MEGTHVGGEEEPSTALPEQSDGFTLLDRFPATRTGHVEFIEWICHEVREQAEAAKTRKYPDESLEKQLAQGIKWDEARQRAEALTDWSESEAKPVIDIFRRELKLGTVERIQELLTPAVRELREALEAARNARVDGSEPAIRAPFLFGELISEITQRDAYYQHAERVAPKVPPMKALLRGSAEAIQQIEAHRLRGQGDKVHEKIVGQVDVSLLRAICESTGSRLDANTLRKLRGQLAVALGIGTDDVDAMELKDFTRKWRGTAGFMTHSLDFSWPTLPFIASCRPVVHGSGQKDGKLAFKIAADGKDLTVIADNVDEAIELAVAKVRPRFIPSQFDVETLTRAVRGFDPGVPNWSTVKGTLAGFGIPVHDTMTIQEIIAALGVRAAAEQRPGPPVEITDSLGRLRKDFPDIGKVCFVVMQFGTSTIHNRILAAIRSALGPHGITALRADDKQYHDDLFFNILTFIHGTEFGIAVFERIENDAFNPNVSLEVGYMLGLGKSVCFLKDRTLRTLHTDLVGKLYRVFDPQDPDSTIPREIGAWLEQKGFTGNLSSNSTH